MNTNRNCGCKSFRSCLLCESQYGIVSSDPSHDSLVFKSEYPNQYSYCSECRRLYPLQNWNECLNLELFHASHENNMEQGIPFSGIKIVHNFISNDEEFQLIKDLDDTIPWDLSQSGRRKQNFGPRANFKKMKTKVGSFKGFPECTKFLQDRFQTVKELEDYKTVEQCSIEYRPNTGACIEPHVDDCWIWGERIVQVNLLSDCVLTLNALDNENGEKYNRYCVDNYPRILSFDGEVLYNPFQNKFVKEYYKKNKKIVSPKACIRVPLPRYSLFLMYGEPRYDWEHCILRDDIDKRRIVIAYRELTPPYLPQGEENEIGSDILNQASVFWNV